MGTRIVVMAVIVMALVPAAARATPAPAATDTLPISIRVDTGEADAALAILARRAQGGAIGGGDWTRLFESEGYRRLEARETSMGRAFEEGAMRAFLLSDSMRARAGVLAETVERWRNVEATGAARRAFTYLPAGTPIRATVYLVIKPLTNSFVFDVHGDPAIFLYVDPGIPPERLANTIAHELHHVGYARACADDVDTTLTEAQRAVRDWMGAFGEGVAVLAAAGGPLEPPDLTWSRADRDEWRRDLRDTGAAMARLERFFTAIADGSLVDPDSTRAQGMAFFGNRGPWYTIGYRMASVVERAFGRERLVSVLCDMRELALAYQSAAPLVAAQDGVELPRWSDRMMAAVRGEIPGNE